MQTPLRDFFKCCAVLHSEGIPVIFRILFCYNSALLASASLPAVPCTHRASFGLWAIISTSTLAPRGRPLTEKQERAG